MRSWVWNDLCQEEWDMKVRRMRMMRFLGTACLTLGLAGGACGADIIVESRPEGQNHANYQEIQGKWINSQTPPEASKSSAPGLTPAAQCGTRKYLFQPEGKTATPVQPAVARFFPRLQSPGHYHVYVTWPKGANVQPVTYRIKHAAGVDEKQVMQDGQGGAGGAGNANRWIPLGDYDFAPGDDQYVELSIGPNAGPVARHLAGQVYADAVRFAEKPLESAPAAARSGNRQPQTPAARTPLPSLPTLPSPPPSSASRSTPAPLPPQPGATRAPASNTGTASAGPEFQWFERLDEALQKAAREKKRVVVFFATPGTERSECIEGQIFGNDVIRRELAWRYLPVKLDMTRHRTTATDLGVFRGGTIVIFSTGGEKREVITECLQPSEFLRYLQ